MEQIIELNNIKDDKNTIEDKIIAELIKSMVNPFDNLTVKEVAKDLKMGLNYTNELFKRQDFPSVCIGKQKTVTLFAYLLWKMKKREKE